MNIVIYILMHCYSWLQMNHLVNSNYFCTIQNVHIHRMHLLECMGSVISSNCKLRESRRIHDATGGMRCSPFQAFDPAFPSWVRLVFILFYSTLDFVIVILILFIPTNRAVYFLILCNHQHYKTYTHMSCGLLMPLRCYTLALIVTVRAGIDICKL